MIPGPDLPGGTSPDRTAEALAELLRTERAQVLATLTRVVGDLGLAEDAVQDAVERALRTWPRDGVPDAPRAWLTVVARRRAIDVVRRESQRGHKEAYAMAGTGAEDGGTADPALAVDDLLRLVFTCCHPALSVETQVALALRTLAGLETAQVAAALLVPEATMAKRLTRARQKIRRAGIPYRVPADHELPDRLAGVAATVYLIFNQGYDAQAGSPPEGAGGIDCAAEAVRLGRLLVRLLPDEPTTLGLLALMLLQHSRRSARFDAVGEPVLLRDQDRGRWDAAEIHEALDLLERALRRTADRPEPYVVQAAIAACHAIAPSYAGTPWDALISWYDTLLTVHDTPVVRLNRAAAVAERDGPAAGLALVDALPGLDGYPWWHAARAELLHRCGDVAAARAAGDRAAATGLAAPYLAGLRRRLAADLL